MDEYFRAQNSRVELILRETCERVLEYVAITKAQLLAVALQMFGEAYMGMRGSRMVAEAVMGRVFLSVREKFMTNTIQPRKQACAMGTYNFRGPNTTRYIWQINKYNR